MLFVVSPQWLIHPLRTVVMTVTLPAQKVLSVIAFEFSDTFRFFSSIGELKEENERLEKERLKLLTQNAQCVDIEKENGLLRRELEIAPREKFSLMTASVIGRDPSGTGNRFSIDKGSMHGIEKGMAVIVDAGVLVGKVADVFPASASVILLTNPESVLSGVALDTEAEGIVRGEHGLSILFDMVLQSNALKQGDTIVTSGLGGDTPRGLIIGTLQEIRFSHDRLFQQASLISPVRFDRLRYVFIIKDEYPR
ncbi:MAG: rod shape-determining protein MreC [Candidatus Moranbacteria bacterium]|nr:rod shape-determining protein MreC [Candidatus Moranbacteria bacterium]